ncbi:MAG: hypothetical protein ACJAZ9_001459 [Neolewinella sp.]|jgi:uncharacterized protein YcbX
MKIFQLFRYPVKSLGGQSLTEIQPEGRGFANDRRWMFVDTNGRFISRRERPQMAKVSAELKGDTLRFVRRSDGAILGAVAGAGDSKESIEVTVWDDTFMASIIDFPDLGPVTDYLEIPGATLVYMGAEDIRPIDPRYAKGGEMVSFADGYPYLVANTASLKDLADRVGDPDLSIRRFRPNIVVEHTEAYAEDGWKSLEIGSHRFRLPKPCARCVMITQDPDTGERKPKVMGELAHYRKEGRKILFGMNACWEGGDGTVSVGDKVSILD